MAFQWTRSSPPATEFCSAAVRGPVIVRPRQTAIYFLNEAKEGRFLKLRVAAMINRSNIGGDGGTGTGSNGGNNINNNRKGTSFTSLPNTNYVVPLGKTSSIIRPLDEILRDLNKKIPDNIIKPSPNQNTVMPWYQANRMLSFYAPGWCGEIRDVIFSDDGSVTVVYRVTIRGSDGEAHREATGTVSSGSVDGVDPVGAAEEIAFCRACARFGLGLYLYHDD